MDKSERIIVSRPTGFATVGPTIEDWERVTERWRELQEELIAVTNAVRRHREPPLDGEEWDDLLANYVELKRVAEELISEGIGIDSNLMRGGVRPLAQKIGLTPAWVARRAKKWREDNLSGGRVEVGTLDQ